jgi:peroxiredoxin
MKLFLLSILSLTSLSLSAQQFTINGRLTGFKDSTKFLLTNLDSTENVYTAYIHNDQLTFKGKVATPTFFRLATPTNSVYAGIWIENKQIAISADSSTFSAPLVKGSAAQEIADVLKADLQMQKQQRDSLVKLATDHQKAADLLWPKINELDDNLKQSRISNIATSTPSIVTINELYYLRTTISTDSLVLLFNRFSAELRNTKYGYVINQYIQTREPQVGDHYTDISGKDFEGKEVKLSDFKGKVILLDFWASWCGPCRMNMNQLAGTYKQYHNKGFEILSFSIDTNKDSWKKISVQDNVQWTNISDLKGNFGKSVASYKVQGIPKAFLIDKNGIIVHIITSYNPDPNVHKEFDDKIAALVKE